MTPELDIAMASSTAPIAHNLRVSIFLSLPSLPYNVKVVVGLYKLGLFLINRMPACPSSVGESGCIQSNKRSASSKLVVCAYISETNCYKLWLHTYNSAQAGLLRGSWDDLRSLQQGDHAPKRKPFCVFHQCVPVQLW